MDGIIERVKDILEGFYYNNYGIYGIGIVIVIDIFVVLKKYYFEE